MAWSETLKLELQPFDIRVVSLITGSIATNVMSHSNLILPLNSIYQKALSAIQLRGVGKDVKTRSTPAEFALEVVKDILGGAKGPLWRGAMASMDRAMKRGTGLDRLP
ncbi:hypothetical protein N7457_004406 [Penicillium paradoxum]|uniref:uncharacterized protein n=1 Tax=Penicillium paradoxum TaxID=176176 RepID=UPI0025478892|nr:uncharacterized protein N7457_004406 [Penicillium paradoxum]KAJ5782632.1 hypothetical protein N7457_004406 [Penicillium paradoxum]